LRTGAEPGAIYSKELIMKGKPEVLQVLQEAMTDEFGAVHGYILHAEMCANWGYKSLASLTTKRAIEEMNHAERLLERILFLDGAPNVQSMPKIVVGQDVEHQFAADLESEQAAIVSYNAAIAACRKAGDDGSAELLGANLRDEERHADYLETQLTLIQQIGLENYLAQMMGE
jgi:bacterioferritin